MFCVIAGSSLHSGIALLQAAGHGATRGRFRHRLECHCGPRLPGGDRPVSSPGRHSSGLRGGSRKVGFTENWILAANSALTCLPLTLMISPLFCVAISAISFPPPGSPRQVMLCLGMIAAMAMDWALTGSGWRWMVAIPSIPGSAMTLSLLLLPESPRWLVMQGRLDEAMEVLHRLLRLGKVGREEIATRLALGPGSLWVL